MNKFFGYIVIFIIVVVVVIMGFFMFSTSQESKVAVTTELLKVEGPFGVSQPMNEVTDVALRDDFPKVTYKNNGSGLGGVLKGEFTLEGLGRGRVYVDTGTPPFIQVMTGQSYIIINTKDPEQTKELYETIKTNLGK